MSIKAIALLSGGLDSTLAVKMMVDQGIEVIALNFTTPFCNCTAKSSSCKHEAVRVAREFGISIRARYKGMEYLRMVENPQHGYGRALNPCIDCRIFMHKQAKVLMEEEGASFIITGEVLGQRPMSQRRQALERIEKHSGTEGLILRPLSAHHFEPTLAERDGLVDRSKLLAIDGRSRKEQIQLAVDLGVSDYPCPAGGCLLTNADFAGKLKDLFDNKPDYDLPDVRLLRVGRHFRLREGLKLVVGRNEGENEMLEKQRSQGVTLVSGEDFNGPTALLREPHTEADLQLVGAIVLHYAHQLEGTIKIEQGENLTAANIQKPISSREIEALRINPLS